MPYEFLYSTVSGVEYISGVRVSEPFNGAGFVISEPCVDADGHWNPGGFILTTDAGVSPTFDFSIPAFDDSRWGGVSFGWTAGVWSWPTSFAYCSGDHGAGAGIVGFDFEATTPGGVETGSLDTGHGPSDWVNYPYIRTYPRDGGAIFYPEIAISISEDGCFALGGTVYASWVATYVDFPSRLGPSPGYTPAPPPPAPISLNWGPCGPPTPDFGG